MVSAQLMRHLTLLIACMMMLLTSWSGVAHAAACIGCPATSAIQQVEQAQAACNDEQAPKKMGKGCLHCQAGCHSQNIGTPLGLNVRALAMPQERMFVDPRRVALITHVGDQALRPPQAGHSEPARNRASI